MARQQVSSSWATRYRSTPSLYALLAISAGLFLQPVSGQENTCQRWGGSGAVANGRLFYSGGWYRSNKAADSVKVSKDLMSIDLSKSWKSEAASMSKIGGVPALYGDSEDNPTPVIISSDDSIFNVYASTNRTQGYTLSVTTAKWEAHIGKISSGFNGLQNLVYTQSTKGGQGWALGQDSKNTDEIAMAGFDLDSGNITAVPLERKLSLPIQGQLQYLPVGQKGALVYFGGTNGGSKVALDNIHVFDIDEGIWREQQTTGTPPSVKGDLSVSCSTYAAARDGSSHSIYVFTSDGNIFILTLPGFMWIQLPMKSENAMDYEPPRKSFNKMATCIVAPGSRQVVILGVGSKEKDSCDRGKGIYVYDMTDISWKEGFEKDKTGYEVPSQVFSKIGGDRNGKATLNSPERGWSTTGLRKVFTGNGGSKTTNEGPKTETSDAPGNPTGNGNNEPIIKGDEEEKKGSKAPILGGVIAGIAIVGLLIGLFLYKRKKKGGRKFDNERPKISSPLPQKEDTMGFDAFSRKSRQSTLRVDPTYQYAMDSRRTSTWSPHDIKDGQRAYGGTINSSTLYTPSTYLGDIPVSPATFQGKFPPGTSVSDIASFKGAFSTYEPSRRGSVDTQMLASNYGNVIELPAHIPAKTFTHSNRTSTMPGYAPKEPAFFGELEGDYSFPIEMGDGTVSPPPAQKKRDSSRSLTLKGIANRVSKSGKSRGSKEYLLQSQQIAELGVPEPAVISPGARTSVSPLNRRSTALGSTAEKAEGDVIVAVARSGSVKELMAANKDEKPSGGSNEIGDFKMDDSKKKKFAGKAKLVDLKRGPSMRKREKEGPLSPKPTVVPGWEHVDLFKDVRGEGKGKEVKEEGVSVVVAVKAEEVKAVVKENGDEKEEEKGGKAISVQPLGQVLEGPASAKEEVEVKK